MSTQEKIRSSNPVGRGDVTGLFWKLRSYSRCMPSLTFGQCWRGFGEIMGKLKSFFMSAVEMREKGHESINMIYIRICYTFKSYDGKDGKVNKYKRRPLPPLDSRSLPVKVTER